MTMADEGDASEQPYKDSDQLGGDLTINNDKDHEVAPAQPPALPPALLPRPKAFTQPIGPSSPTFRVPQQATAGGNHLQSYPTTALSSIDIQTQSFPDGSRGTFSISSDQPTSTCNPGMRKVGQNGSETDESVSLTSHEPTPRAIGDLESLLGDDFNGQSPAWKLLSSQKDSLNPFETVEVKDDDRLLSFEHEFDEIADIDSKAGNEDECLLQWKSKLKHFLILSSAGKPIYSRHGDQNLVNGYIGIIQTIISFYEGAEDPLKGFNAGGTRFVVITQGPLYLVAISRLGESDTQLRVQLEALYMQILSTLTLPTLTRLFTNRPSTDLRRPLHGTESLLSSLADTFTKGSASTLLSALECLKIRKSERHVINNTLLKSRTEKLLYGLIVAGGRLVSVIRPKRHSLHPSDLQLIFNMLFEADGVKAGGGENWIPLCLPGFNNGGFLYMYVSFLDAFGSREANNAAATKPGGSGKDDEIAVLLISADKESFYELKQMRDNVVALLEKTGSMNIIKNAIRNGRPCTTEISPGTQLQHFLYKSRSNVQFTMSSYWPHFDTMLARRRLLSLYHGLHASAHAKHTHLKVLYCVTRQSISLAWITPIFEFYCVADSISTRAGLAQGANKMIQWVKREEERVFIIGGAVF